LWTSPIKPETGGAKANAAKKGRRRRPDMANKNDMAVDKTVGTAEEVVESKQAAETAEAMKPAENGIAAGGLLVTREAYMAKKNKKMYHAYFVSGEVRGHKVKAEIAPPKM